MFLALLFGIVLIQLSSAYDVVKFSNNNNENNNICNWETAAASATGQNLVFVFEDFTFGEFSKKVGAYDENLKGDFILLKNWAEEKPFCEFETSQVPTSSSLFFAPQQVKEIMDVVKTGKGTHLIHMNTVVNEGSEMDDAIISEIIKEAVIATTNGKVSVYLTGKSSKGRRSLAALTPLVLMSPETFIGLLFLVLVNATLIFFLCCCMDSISSQSKLAKQYPLRGKEFN